MQDNLLGNLVYNIWHNIDDEEILSLFSSEVKIPHSGYDRCYVTKSANQTIVNGLSWKTITWDEEQEDTNNLHDNITNNERITIQKSGKYNFIYKIETEASDKSSYTVRLYKNGVAAVSMSCLRGVGSKDASTIILTGITPIINLISGDYITVQVFHDNDLSQDIIANDSFFFCERRY